MEDDAEASINVAANAKSKNFTIFGPTMTLNVDQIWPKSNQNLIHVWPKKVHFYSPLG